MARGLAVWLGTRLAAHSLRRLGQPCGRLEDCPAWPAKLSNPRGLGGVDLALIKAIKPPIARWLRLPRQCTSVCVGRFARAPIEPVFWQCPGLMPARPPRLHSLGPRRGAHAGAPSVRHQTILRCGCVPHVAPHGHRCGNRHWLAIAEKAMWGANSSVMGVGK